MPRVHIEIMPWLSKTVGKTEWGKVVAEQSLPDGATLRDLIFALAADHAAFGETVWNAEGGHVAEEITVLVNGRLSDLQHGADTPLRDDDLVIFLPGFAGGGR